jgi:hypothetical protein
MYTNPAVGTIFTGQPNTTIDNPGPVHSAKGDALNEWLQAQAQQTAYAQTQAAAKNYREIDFGNWFTNYDTGRVKGPTGIMGDPDAPPPQPPPAFVVVVVKAQGNKTNIGFEVQPSGQDATLDDSGTETYPATGPYIPACDVPDYRKITAPQKPGTGKIKS